MKNLRNNLKKNKKGFTLVEIIVVLVILAVLAAASIPTMIGFVEDAKGKAEIANARAAYLACQSVATEEYASGLTSASTPAATLISGTTYTIASTTATKGNVNLKLDTMLGKDMADATVSPTITTGKVDKVVFVNKGYTVTISAGKETTVVKN